MESIEMSEEQEAEYRAWKHQPMTRRFFDRLKNARDAEREKLSDGRTLAITADETLKLTAGCVGYCTAIGEVQDIDYFMGAGKETAK